MIYQWHYLRLFLTAVMIFPALTANADVKLLTQPGKTQALSRTAWVNEKWTANDKPFLLTKKQVQREVEATRKTSVVATKYGTLFNNNAGNTLLLFKWGLATYYTAEPKPSTWFPTDSDLLLTALNNTSSPHSLQYDRMRFLIQSRFRGEGFLKTMGLRLLKHDPNDDEVRASMFSVLNIVGSSTDGQLAVTFARQLIAKHPSNPRWYAMLGAAYNLMSIKANDRLYCEKSINAYQDYLRLAKKDDPFYSHAQYMISVIKKNMPQ